MKFAATWMELEIIILSKISQTKKTNIIRYHFYEELKKNDTSELRKQK